MAVVVHESIATEVKNTEQLINIYTLKSQIWDDNNRIRIADYKGENYLRMQFYDALNISTNDVKKIWLRAQLTGRSVPPKVVDSVQSMIDLIRRNPGTVGYLPFDRVPADFNILFEIQNGS
ncbi:MAG: hypothetical protein NXI08_06535 [bacterium]|nr:hypothetical protein [bacterium]